MPLYEYRCKQCGHRFEKIQTYSAPDEKECPVCKSEVERLISAPAAHFKGSGFYSTDYAVKPAASNSSETGPKDTGSKDSSAKKSGGGDSKSADSGKSASGESAAKPSTSSESSSAPASSSNSSSSSSKE